MKPVLTNSPSFTTDRQREQMWGERVRQFRLRVVSRSFGGQDLRGGGERGSGPSLLDMIWRGESSVAAGRPQTPRGGGLHHAESGGGGGAVVYAESAAGGDDGAEIYAESAARGGEGAVIYAEPAAEGGGGGVVGVGGSGYEIISFPPPPTRTFLRHLMEM